MKNNIKLLIGTGMIAFLILFIGCKKTNDYSLGDLTTPTNLVLNLQVEGQDGTNPNGDGSGNVIFTPSADNALAYKIQYDITNSALPEPISKSSVTHKYSQAIPGTYTYTVTLIAYGKGGTSSSITKDITVYSSFTPDPAIVTNLTGDASKTWVVDKDLAGHFGVGPWSVTSVRPEWYAAAPNEKAVCCPCFYSASFIFTKGANNAYSLEVVSPQGAFTKTGALAGGLPGIPASGDEGCYSYSGGSSPFAFLQSTSGVPLAPSGPGNFPSTGTSILLSGVNTFIGYGATLKEYEILTIDTNTMFLRVQGTETGDAWYIRLKAI